MSVWEVRRCWHQDLPSSDQFADVRALAQVLGGVTNNFAQAADKSAAVPIDIVQLRRHYPEADIEVVDLQHWVDADVRRNDGRYLNQVR